MIIIIIIPIIIVIIVIIVEYISFIKFNILDAIFNLTMSLGTSVCLCLSV